ncbi:Translation initiation factor eIF-2B subunit gamma [Meyerozyma sp. JA9]|nr:Translation initiation factor eIF-2B subunit gamma [Meyerozyma sp. JA9]
MEFQAIILCGKGHGLAPFSKVRSTGVPKPLLPIANRPMVDYVLDWCQRAFFPSVTLVCNGEDKQEIAAAVDAYQAHEGADSEWRCKIDVVDVSVDGSGDALYYMFHHKLIHSKDFVVLPCDFVTNLPPQVLIEAYRNRADTDVGLAVCYKNQLDIEDKKATIFPKNYTFYTDPSLDDNANGQLLDAYSADDVGFHKSLQIRTQMCWRYPHSRISTKLLNSGIFFGSSDAITRVFESHRSKFSDSYFKTRSVAKVVRDFARRSWKHKQPLDTVGFTILPEQAMFFRSNHPSVWMEANRHFMKERARKQGQKTGSSHASFDKQSRSAVGLDSLIGANTTLGEKTNVKRTVVGRDCKVGDRVRLTGCLVMDGVVVENDVQLENCIIGKNAVIRGKVRLVNCYVECTNDVPAKTNSKGDTLLSLSLDGLDEVESESESESGSSDESDYEYEGEYDDNADGLFGY